MGWLRKLIAGKIIAGCLFLTPAILADQYTIDTKKIMSEIKEKGNSAVYGNEPRCYFMNVKLGNLDYSGEVDVSTKPARLTLDVKASSESMKYTSYEENEGAVTSTVTYSDGWDVSKTSGALKGFSDYIGK